MLIDIHTHFVRCPEDFTEPFFSDLERCGIPLDSWCYNEKDYLEGTAAADKVVVFGLSASKTGWYAQNQRVAELVRRYPGKYIFFTSIDPAAPDFMDQLRRDHLQMGCKGVKLGPIYQGVHPLDPRYLEIYDYCEKNGLPIMTHMAATFSSGVPLEYARPALMDRVACEFPRLKIVLAHLGHPWIDECIAAIRHQPNLYADISALYYRPWQFYNALASVQEYGAGHKLLFGSDFPATTTADSIVGLRGVNCIAEKAGLPLISQDLIEGILNRDSLAVLGIDQEE